MKFFEDALFQEKDGRWALTGSRCRQCRKISFPPSGLCVNCLSEEMEPAEISSEGSLYSYTITRRPVGNWKPPFAIGLVSLPQQELRIMAPLVMDGDEDFHIGEKLEMILDKYWDEADGSEIYGYKFRRIDDHREG